MAIKNSTIETDHVHAAGVSPAPNSRAERNTVIGVGAGEEETGDTNHSQKPKSRNHKKRRTCSPD